MPGLGCRNNRCCSEMARTGSSRLLLPWCRAVITWRPTHPEHVFIPGRQGFRVLCTKEHAANSSYVFHGYNMEARFAPPGSSDSKLIVLFSIGSGRNTRQISLSKD